MDNEVMELIDQLYTMVSEAWGVPLGNEKCIVERDQVLEILDEIKTAMPVELSEAKRLVSARDEFINNAKREAEGIRNQAEERARALVDDQEIVRIAKARSNEMLASTQAKADALRRASSQFCDEARRRPSPPRSAACSRRTPRSRTLPAARLRPPLPLQPDSRRSASRARKPPRRKPTDLPFPAHPHRRRYVRRRWCVLPKFFPAGRALGASGGDFFTLRRHILCRCFPFFGGKRKCLWPEKPQSD